MSTSPPPAELPTADPVDSPSTDSSSSSSESEDEVDITERTDIPAHMQPQVERLKQLRQRL
ncbi:hypothetical protein IWW52_002498, partial [Coemansia sp. RSA 2704]